MKRNLGLALIAILVILLTLLLLPTGLAKRNDKLPKHNNGKNAPLDTDLIKPNTELFEKSIAQPSGRQDQAQTMTVGRSVKNDESPAMRDMPLSPMKAKPEDREANENPKLPHTHIDKPDPVIQSSFGALRDLMAPSVMPSPILNFDGILFPGVACSCAPPDTVGEVGLTQYVQMVNEGFQVFDKTTGASTFGPAGISTLWNGFGGVCENNGSGDPVVMYDQLADRWVITQFAGASVPTDECIAVSKTGDATGAYYRYDFNLGTNFFDYPHLGVWPDGYYMAMNVFNTAGTAFLGPQAFVFDRAKMIAGLPATFQTPGITGGATEDTFLPADLDGYALPPAGAPNSFVETPFTGTYRTFHFHVDWAVPANSTFTLFANPVSAAFTELCPTTRSCVPQLGTADGLDGIGDRLMYRLAYRNIGGVESLVGNHTVSAGGVAAPRWFELRGVTAGPVTVAQESTYQPDTTWRWMGSAAQDNQGNLAVGYSASSATINPQIRYAGRLATDPVNTLAQGEATLHAGTGSQTGTGNRWGDYSDMTVDPSDDCTFWYTQEYYSTTATFSWRTRIGNFKFPICTQSARGTISGTITNCQTGLPIPNAQVTIGGGYVRGTDAAGMYSAIVAPGTYNASVTGTGYDIVSQMGLVVSNGGNVTFSGCLTGNLKQPVADTANITADSCNSNGAIDPNETITISLGLKNTGTLSTVNLVGTLQATGGVTSPSGPQNYGVVVAGGATVSRNFTFTAGNLACGAPVVLSLQLQDGATNLGTVTYNFTTGTILVNNYSSGDISVAIPDNNLTGVDIPITVADVMALSDVNVSFRINHTFDGDLQISLIHPDNTSIPLSTNRGGSGDNFGTGALSCAGVPTVIDDAAATAISAGAAPFNATFRPESPLSALNGKPSNGIWKLHVVDNAGTDTGTVGCFKLELNRRNVCCGALISSAPPAVITAESISPANNAPDPEETVTVNLPLVNNGGSPTTNLVATLQPTGGVAGPSGPQTYGALAATGGTATRPYTFTAQGTCGSNITLTLALQDGPTNLGTVTFTMQLGTTAPSTTSFSNTTSVTIPASGTGATTGAPANPYPSNIIVSGLTGTVSKVTVNLNGLNHTFPDDVDILLVAPTGEKFIIVSDAGGTNDWVNANITLDDSAAALMSDSGANPTGTYKPTNYGTGDAFPAPAPAAPYQNPATAGSATFAGVFNGLNPNGTWGLYVVDDLTGDVGTMSGGWTINITTAVPICNTQSCMITAPASITIPAGTCGTIVNYSPAVTFTGACGTVVVDPPTGSFFGIGTRTVLVRGTKADMTFTDASFPVTVQENESQPTNPGMNVTNTFCNATVTFSSVNSPPAAPAGGGGGTTTVTNAPAQMLPPPYLHCASCPELNISTTAGFTPPVTTCITMPMSTDFNTFSRLRILHGEPGLVNRTISSDFGTKVICARTTTLSPFVVALDPSSPTASGATVSGRIVMGTGTPVAGVAIRLSGAASVTAITDANGNYRFANVDVSNFYTVTPTLANYQFSPASRSFSLLGDRTDATFTATADTVIGSNAIDTSEYFVRQQYLDFLGREPEAAGLNYWNDQVNACRGDADCVRTRRIEVSAAFFLSQEFRDTGSFVYRLYRGALGRQLRYSEFSADRAQVVGGPNLEASKAAFADAFVQRAEFAQRYQPHRTAESFVDALLQTTFASAGVDLAGERAALISRYNEGRSLNASRSLVVRQLVDNDSFSSAVYNQSFVAMQYFGYLQRSPDSQGYNFWLNVLNSNPGNYRGMVCSFITSTEYQRRFSPVVSHSNAECGQ